MNIPNDALVMMVGIPGSGKSTMAKKLAGDDKESIISIDAIREELFGNPLHLTAPGNKLAYAEFSKRIEQRLKEGKFTIADDPSLMFSSSRKDLYKLAQKYKKPIIIVIMNISSNIALEQNSQRAMQLSADVITRSFEDFQGQYALIHDEIQTIPNAQVVDIAMPPEKGKAPNRGDVI